MDPFDDLLRGVRADGAGVDRRELSPPWTLTFTDETTLTMCAPLRGEARLSSHGKPVRVGETAIVRGPFTVSGSEPAVLLIGRYNVRSKVAQRLVGVLPPAVVVPDGDGCESVREFVDTQFTTCGSQVVLDRLLDWLLVCTLRGWFDQPEAVTPAWLGALNDDTVGPALRAMHGAPDKPWTLASLAREAGVSRTTLADRFTKVVGEPPLTYLTDWRMSLAADLLTNSTATVAAVARQVGYADAFGFSAAFKRVHGSSPSEYRKTCRTDAECVGTECSPA